MRGERRLTQRERQHRAGSSPHARGTRRRTTHAPRGRPVHPRMRGERTRPAVRLSKIVGSSPHARGTLALDLSRETNLRFIPACAGNAPSPLAISLFATVHPRRRGERLSIQKRNVRSTGSSPHARGTL